MENRDILDNVSCGVVFMDTEQRIIRANKAFEELCGVSAEKMKGKICYEVWYNLQAPCEHCPVLKAMSSGQFEKSVVSQSDGTVLDITGSPVIENGKLIGAVETFIDVTGTFKSQEQLISAKESAEIANRVKSEFLANMSHEIRTPMTAILGYAELLFDGVPDEETHKEYLNIIKDNGHHLLEIINDILDLSKIDSGQMQLKKSSFNLSSLISEVVATMKVRANDKGIEFNVKYKGETPKTVVSDNLRLKQCLVNLIGNAIKFTDHGGVTLEMSYQADQQPQMICFEVVDTGVGISPEDQGNLFKPFVQIDASLTRHYGGTGLGLAITKSIVDLMGGTLTFKSKLGKGSTFIMTVPVGEVQNLEMIDDKHQAEILGTDFGTDAGLRIESMNILLVEDGLDTQRFLSTLLGKAGASISVASNGKDAIRYAMAREFDVILMDMQMPEMDGYQATRVLRKSGYKKPIVALTAHAMSGDREKCLRFGCDEYLSKPVLKEQLLELILKYKKGQRQPTHIQASPAEEIHKEVLTSTFLDDPEMRDLVVEFVNGLDERIKSIHDALESGSFEDVRNQAHQLKGAGGSYGYPTLTAIAADLEQSSLTPDHETTSMNFAKLKTLCEAIKAGCVI